MLRCGRTHNAGQPIASGRLDELRGFGSNPGALRANMYLPETAPANPALVVVLHGCTQDAEGYDAGAGWSQLADRHGFALLFPEQQRQNNPNLCFNWFSPEDQRRGHGEALSIREMVAAMVERHGIDEERIFVTGLSAGGAMAAVMLATYPEVFAGGAIIAGLPYGCAGTVPQAFERMRGQNMPNATELAALVRSASSYSGRWPTVSVWQGSGDATVNPTNAGAIVAQWRLLHGVGEAPNRRDVVDGYPRRIWRDGSGREVIEEYSITGMGHGTPLDTLEPDACGRSGAFMLDVGISSTRHIARSWGLLDQAPTTAASPQPAEPTSQVPALRVTVARRLPPDAAAQAEKVHEPNARAKAATGASGVGKVIEDALRSAGLMR